MADDEETRSGDEPPAKEPSKKYDQNFFLDLAAHGKDAWNAWRRDPANKNVRVTFKNVQFSQAPRDEIDFSRFEFGNGADFSGCKWRGVGLEELESTERTEAFMPGCAFFTSALFGNQANFANAEFGGEANFLRAAFGEGANFADAEFPGRACPASAHVRQS
jgi:hypothetical protein